MEPTYRFRRIIRVGLALEGKARGPLVYSGSEITLAPAYEFANWRVVYWFWCPPGQRYPRKFTSEVTDADARELAALADGTLEEVAFNVRWPRDMSLNEATRRLQEDYDRRCVQRLGLVGLAGSANSAPVSILSV